MRVGGRLLCTEGKWPRESLGQPHMELFPFFQTLREQRCGNGGRANCDVSFVQAENYLGVFSFREREKELSIWPRTEDFNLLF